MVKTARIEEPEGKKHPLPDLSQVQSNGPSREDTLFAIGQIKAIEAELSLIQAKRKKMRNVFKFGGHSLDALDWGVAEEKRMDGNETAKWRERVRVAQFMSLPIGRQVSFLDAPDAAPAESPDLSKQAYDEGYERGIKGDFPDEQKWMPLTPEGQQHVSGWDDAQQTYREKIGRLNEAIADKDKDDAAKKAKAKKAADDEEAEPDAAMVG